MYLILSLVHVRMNAMFAWMSLSDWRTAGRIERSERGRKGKAEKVIMQYTVIYHNVPLQQWFFTSKCSDVLVCICVLYQDWMNSHFNWGTEYRICFYYCCLRISLQTLLCSILYVYNTSHTVYSLCDPLCTCGWSVYFPLFSGVATLSQVLYSSRVY